jgi:nitronate monooxygenase
MTKNSFSQYNKIMKKLTEILNIKEPIIMAPMFLVSNKAMMLSASEAGIAGCIPAHNYKDLALFDRDLKELKEKCKHSFGVNLIVNKSNIYYKKQLEICVKNEIDFIITSLGSPHEVIKNMHSINKLVFCDVVDLEYAKKCQELGADAVIAVNSQAGGHAGKLSPDEIITLLKKNLKIPIISAGGVGSFEEYKQMMERGVSGVSVGSIFIASTECPVTQEYKEACVKYGKNDIVMTDKISGTPCTVINTPYVQKIGTKQNFIESILNKHKKLKKWMKMLTFFKGMKAMEKAAFSASYKTIWCAGPSIEHTKSILPISQIVKNLTGK